MTNITKINFLLNAGTNLIHNLNFFPNVFVILVSGDKNISILHLPCRTSDLQFSLALQTNTLVLKIVCNKENGEWGGNLMFFENPYITAKMIFTHCSQFHNIPYTDKKSSILMLRLSFLKITFTFRFFCRNFRMSFGET